MKKMSNSDLMSPGSDALFSQASLEDVMSADTVISNHQRGKTDSWYFEGPSKFIRITTRDNKDDDNDQTLNDVMENDDYSAFDSDSDDDDFQIVSPVRASHPSKSQVGYARKSINPNNYNSSYDRHHEKEDDNNINNIIDSYQNPSVSARLASRPRPVANPKSNSNPIPVPISTNSHKNLRSRKSALSPVLASPNNSTHLASADNQSHLHTLNNEPSYNSIDVHTITSGNISTHSNMDYSVDHSTAASTVSDFKRNQRGSSPKSFASKFSKNVLSRTRTTASNHSDSQSSRSSSYLSSHLKSSSSPSTLEAPPVPPSPLSNTKKFHKTAFSSIFVSSQEVQRQKQMSAYLESKRGVSMAQLESASARNSISPSASEFGHHSGSSTSGSSSFNGKLGRKRGSVAFGQTGFKTPYRIDDGTEDNDSIVSVSRKSGRKSLGRFFKG